jgi:hypothetical protein
MNEMSVQSVCATILHRGKLKYKRKTCPECHFVHQKHPTDRPEIGSMVVRWLPKTKLPDPRHDVLGTENKFALYCVLTLRVTLALNGLCCFVYTDEPCWDGSKAVMQDLSHKMEKQSEWLIDPQLTVTIVDTRANCVITTRSSGSYTPVRNRDTVIYIRPAKKIFIISYLTE